MTREPIVAHILMPINQYCKDYCSCEATVMPWLHDNLLPDLNQLFACLKQKGFKQMGDKFQVEE